MDDKDIFDIEEALKMVDNDMEFFKELTSIFLENCPKQLGDIRDAIANNDAKLLERSSHGIKGSLGAFCAKSSHDIASKLEMMGRENNLNHVKEIYDTLENEVNKLVSKLEMSIKER